MFLEKNKYRFDKDQQSKTGDVLDNVGTCKNLLKGNCLKKLLPIISERGAELKVLIASSGVDIKEI